MRLSTTGHALYRTKPALRRSAAVALSVRQVELRRSGDRVRHNRERGWTGERIGTASSCMCGQVRCGSGWADESVGKPDSVAHRERRGAIIHLRPLLPAAWCDLPGGSGEQPSGASADARTRPLDLAPGGVCRATPVAWGAGGLLHHRFTLTSERGGLFSVALSRGSPRVGVTHHRALWSPDFPRPASKGGPRSPDRLVRNPG